MTSVRRGSVARYAVSMKLLAIVAFVQLLTASAFSPGALAQSSVPENATPTFGGGWTCDLGYRRVANRCEKVAVPPNASATFAGGWTCDLGYRRVADRCEKVAVPPNASATFGGDWECDFGFKRAASECVPMTPDEKRVQQAAIASILARERSRMIRLDDYEFTLADVERRCEAYVYNKPHGELECSGNVRILQRRCEVYIHSWPNGEISCRGSELSVVARRCSVSMHSERYGSVSC